MRAALVTACVLSMLVVSAPSANADLLTATPASVAGATLAAAAPSPTAPPGVSPEVFVDGSTYHLWTTGGNARAYTSTDGRTWTAVDGARLPLGGADWSVVQEGPGSYRMYFAEMTGAQPCTTGAKRLRYATSSDLLTWTVQPGSLIDDIGCGVPHVMKTTDGRYFAYYNLMMPERGVHVATSGDGLAWTVQDVILANDPDVVDPAPVQMPDGTFLMLATKHGGPGGYKALRILTSKDAIHWVERSAPLASLRGGDALDPTVELVDGKLRVWFAFAPGGDMSAARIAAGDLTLKPAAPKPGARCAKRGSRSGPLVCVKSQGKLVWARR